MVEGLLAFIVTASDPGTTLATHRIDLIDEDDAGGLFLGLTEQIANPAGADTHKKLNKLGGRDRAEGHPRFSRNRFGKKRFSGSWRTDQQDAAGDLRSKPNEGLRLFEKGDHLLKFEPCIVDAGHILKTQLQILLGLQPRLTAPKTQSPIRHLG